MINNVTLMGRLVSDPELKTTPAGVSVTSFRIAVDRGYVGKDGQRQADFPTIVAWRNTAEFICKYFKKGNMLALQGQIQTRAYKTADGQNRVATEILAEKASFTGEKPSGLTTSQTAPQQAATPQQQATPQTAPQQAAPQQPTLEEFGDNDFVVDDLPF